jgi:hypothetical protein
MRGTWLLPTRGRPAALSRFFKAALETEQTTPGIVLYSNPADIYNVEIPYLWSVRKTEAEGMGPKLREVWPIIKNMDWVGWIVDDQTPITPKWDKVLLSGINGRNIISCNDEHRAPFRMCTPMFSGDILRAVGYLYPEGMWHAWADDMWEALGTATNSWWVCMEVVVKHADGFKTGIVDETHKISYSRMAEDQRVFENWKRTDMDRAVLAILNLPVLKAKEVAYG